MHRWSCSDFPYLGHREEKEPASKRERFLGLFSRKRKQRSPSPPLHPVLLEPTRLNFLFVGNHSVGQTSLL